MTVPASAMPLPRETEKTKLAALVDEFGAIHVRIKDDAKKYEQLKKQLAALVSENQDEGETVLEGEDFVLIYSAPTTKDECTLNPEEFIEQTGAWEAVKISTKEARDTLPPSVYLEMFKQVQGSRRLKDVVSQYD